MQKIRSLVKEKEIQSPELKELDALLRAMPPDQIERYMADNRARWERWAKRVIDFYGKCSAEQRVVVADALVEKFGHIIVHLPKDLFILEILWDFGDDSESFSLLPDLFSKLLVHHQATMEPEIFQRDIIHRLREGGIVPIELWKHLDMRDRAPSKEISTRLRKVEHDMSWERRLLQQHVLPGTGEDMFHLLRKMRKGNMGLPEHWPDFLKQVHTHFQTDGEWSEIKEEMDKIQKKFPDWYALQTR